MIIWWTECLQQGLQEFDTDLKETKTKLTNAIIFFLLLILLQCWKVMEKEGFTQGFFLGGGTIKGKRSSRFPSCQQLLRALFHYSGQAVQFNFYLRRKGMIQQPKKMGKVHILMSVLGMLLIYHINYYRKTWLLRDKINRTMLFSYI